MFSPGVFFARGEPFHGEDGVFGHRADGPDLIDRPARMRWYIR